ncbi:aspartate/glutamate racemase family protein [Candidatus Dojkabacteria bacterium]|nr:aspartate/glutamate racemase family protein [Candidatus Dojkabacteria bacterium]
MSKTKNKKVGIIGGVGPQATSVLYSEIVRFAQIKYKARDNDDYPYVLIESVPIPDFISDKSHMNEAFKMLEVTVENLAKVGCTRICIASNTVHLLLPRLRETTKVKFISMIELVAQKCKELGFKRVGIVASSMTIGTGLYRKVLGRYDIDVIRPNCKQRKVIDKIIRYVLAGEDNGRERKEYIGILHDLIDNGAEGIILGCTELPLAINYEALGNKVINSMKVLGEGVVDYYYS